MQAHRGSLLNAEWLREVLANSMNHELLHKTPCAAIFKLHQCLDAAPVLVPLPHWEAQRGNNSSKPERDGQIFQQIWGILETWKMTVHPGLGEVHTYLKKWRTVRGCPCPKPSWKKYIKKHCVHFPAGRKSYLRFKFFYLDWDMTVSVQQE